MVAGVAGGLGRYFDVDPVLVRIAIVVLTFFGGAGVLLYLAAVLLVPYEDEVGAAAATGAAPPPDRNRALVIIGAIVLVVVVGPVLLGPALAVGALLVPLAFLVLAGLAVAWLVTGRRPDREPGALLRATLLGVGILVLASVLAIASFWAAGVGGEGVVAAIVIAAGVAILAGAFIRPVRWLIVPALAVALPATFVAAAGIDLSGGIGERTYRPASSTQLERRYELGTGQLTVDVRDAKLTPGDHRIDLSVGMGEAVVLVPDDVCVATRARIGAGAADVFDHSNGGVDVHWAEAAQPKPRAARLLVDADIGLGHLDVRKSDRRPHRTRNPDEWDWQDWNTDRGKNTACAA
jgi:phage shock protein PspC (stress-responsive transcriptional regulator)